ncbi:unnamed protein product, partial [Scytosiphon promiscuus]
VASRYINGSRVVKNLLKRVASLFISISIGFGVLPAVAE